MKLAFWRNPRINVIELHGIISPRVGALNATSVASCIKRAFATSRGQPVILDIECPGGSPVQADLIAASIRREANRHKVTVYAVIREVGASGGYWLACAGDQIYANPMSIVGSIGVVGGGFGFPDLLARLGIQRRLYTVGRNKARLDPFSPERADDIAFMRGLMEAVHARFKEWVRIRRSDRLRGDEATMFDGGFMLGEQALTYGLIDRLGDVDTLIQELAGDKGLPRRFTPRRRGLLSRLPRLVAEALLDTVDERGTWPRMEMRIGEWAEAAKL